MIRESSGKKPTMADIAKLAGVSKTAVSAVMHHGKGKTTRVGEETAKLIHAAAEQLGYRTNYTAQSLATGRTGFIGFMLSSTVDKGFMNPYFAGFLQGAEEECRRRGYGLAVSCAPFSEAGRFINSNILSQRRIDGLIAAGELDSGVYRELASTGTPFVVVNALPSKGLPTLTAKPHADVARLALSLGHRRILMTRDAGTEEENKAILEGIKAALGDAVSVSFAIPAKGEHPNWEPGFGLGASLFRIWSGKSPSERASLVFSNGVLVELDAELAKAGVKRPEELSLLGDNSFDFHYGGGLRFSRIHVDHQAIGADAADFLIKAIESSSSVSPEACAKMDYALKYVPGETVKEASR